MKPRTEAELADLVTTATGPLRVQGGGTRPIGHATGEVLSVAGVTGIDLYEPGALTVVVAAGTPMAELEAALDAENQRLAFEPMDHRGLLGTKGSPTIGGVIAGNISGPRRIQVGAARDFMLGVRFVDGSGSIIKNGGRVMKNVTGYDLVKLMSGSFGTLGVMTQVSLKVLPKPEQTGTVAISGLDDETAIAALSAALGSPFDVSGAAHLPKSDGREAQTLVRVEGFAASVEYRLKSLSADLSKFGETAQITDTADNAALWADIKNVVPFHGKTGDVWRISVKPSDAAQLVTQLAPQDVVYDWGGGLIWALMPEGANVRPITTTVSGHATRVRGAGPEPAFQPEPDVLAKISAGLRQKFDPRGIFNSGLMG